MCEGQKLSSPFFPPHITHYTTKASSYLYVYNSHLSRWYFFFNGFMPYSPSRARSPTFRTYGPPVVCRSSVGDRCSRAPPRSKSECVSGGSHLDNGLQPSLQPYLPPHSLSQTPTTHQFSHPLTPQRLITLSSAVNHPHTRAH